MAVRSWTYSICVLFLFSLQPATILCLDLVNFNLTEHLAKFNYSTSVTNVSQDEFAIPRRQRYPIPGTQMMLYFLTFNDALLDADGNALLHTAQQAFLSELHMHQPLEPVEDGYWAADEQPLELEIRGNRIGQPELQYGDVGIVLMGLRTFFPFITTTHPQVRQFYACEFAVAGPRAIGIVQLGVGRIYSPRGTVPSQVSKVVQTEFQAS